MADVKDLKLTSDPLTNIKMMIPLLDDEGRKAFSFMMYGYNVHKDIAEKKKEKAGV